MMGTYRASRKLGVSSLPTYPMPGNQRNVVLLGSAPWTNAFILTETAPKDDIVAHQMNGSWMSY